MIVALDVDGERVRRQISRENHCEIEEVTDQEVEEFIDGFWKEALKERISGMDAFIPEPMIE